MLDAIAKANENDEVAAIIMEPLLQAAGGMRMYGPAELDTICHICQNELKEIHNKRLATPKPVDNVENTLIRALRDIPTFAGVDGNEYELSAQDIVTVPEVHAKALIKRKAAVQVQGLQS